MVEARTDPYDVIVVVVGNAALCAALSAREEGARVLLMERAPEEERGGNSAFTEGLIRIVYRGADDIKARSPDLTPEEMASDFGAYTEEKFFDDMARITQNRTDPDLCEIQHGRRAGDGIADRGTAVRSLVRMPRGRLGTLRRRFRRSGADGRLRAGQLSVLAHGEQ